MLDFSYAREVSKGKRSSLLYLERKQNPWNSSSYKQYLPYFTISITNRHYWSVYKGALITVLICILTISHTQKDLVFLKLSEHFFQAIPTVRTVFQWALQLIYYLFEIQAVQFANLNWWNCKKTNYVAHLTTEQIHCKIPLWCRGLNGTIM